MTNLCSSFGIAEGVEPIPEVVDYARKLFPSINFRVGTPASVLETKGQSQYEVVVCSEVIEHVSRDKQISFLETIKKLLTPKGYLILTTPRGELQHKWVELYGTPGQPLEEWLTSEQVYQITNKVGFIKKELKYASVMSIYQIWLFQVFK